MAPTTRNTTLKEIHTKYMTGRKQLAMFTKLTEECVDVDICSAEVFTTIVERVSYDLRAQFNDSDLTSHLVKTYMSAKRDEYYQFKEFTFNTPGVRIITDQDEVTVDNQYWDHLQKLGTTESKLNR